MKIKKRIFYSLEPWLGTTTEEVLTQKPDRWYEDYFCPNKHLDSGYNIFCSKCGEKLVLIPYKVEKTIITKKLAIIPITITNVSTKIILKSDKYEDTFRKAKEEGKFIRRD